MALSLLGISLGDGSLMLLRSCVGILGTGSSRIPNGPRRSWGHNFGALPNKSPPNQKVTRKRRHFAWKLSGSLKPELCAGCLMSMCLSGGDS